jgi:hypothetical protein
MIGAFGGDVIGSRLEFNNHWSRDFELFHPHISLFTDDTVLTVAVAKWQFNGDNLRDMYLSTTPNTIRSQ